MTDLAREIETLTALREATRQAREAAKDLRAEMRSAREFRQEFLAAPVVSRAAAGDRRACARNGARPGQLGPGPGRAASSLFSPGGNQGMGALAGRTATGTKRLAGPGCAAGDRLATPRANGLLYATPMLPCANGTVTDGSGNAESPAHYGRAPGILRLRAGKVTPRNADTSRSRPSKMSPV